MDTQTVMRELESLETAQIKKIIKIAELRSHCLG